MHVNARAIIERESSNGREIVIQIRNKPHEGGKWIELPGGHVEEYESLLEAVKREVREETGLDLVEIEGENTKIEAVGPDTKVECLVPLAVYQTIRGPVDSIGVYFRCKAEGHLQTIGDDTESVQWMPVESLRQWVEKEPAQFSWIDRAGLLFYLKPG
jgi:ADP-ribose pyrophosphatase YjhB (NUDIX family)